MIQHLTEIVEEARKKGKKRLAVAYGQDSHTLEAVYGAYKEGLVEPTLYGDKAVIEQVCKENDLDINAFTIVHEPNDMKCVQQAVASVVAGNA
ncbi:MAG: phosphate butyryltransferase, partial [Alistipes sp.]|nr:phosphate butyryltransferase [Alistipes sp.]